MHSCRQVIAAQPAPKEHLWIKKSKLRDRITFSNTSAYSGRKKKKRLNKKPSYLETMKEVKKFFFFFFNRFSTFWVIPGIWQFSSNLYLGFCVHEHRICLCTGNLHNNNQKKKLWIFDESHYAYQIAPWTSKLRK